MKKALLLTTALATSFAGQAMAVEASVFGQVNKAVMVYDDGRDQDTAVVDNNNASTIVGFEGEQMLDNGLTASFLMSAYLRNNRSNQVTQNTAAGQSSTPVSSSNSFEEAYARVGLSGEWGGVFIGQQDTAIDDTFYQDLAAASDVMGPGVAAFGGGVVFRNSAGNQVSLGGTNVTAAGLAQGFDGSIELEDSIRYNSPVFNGFNLSVSTSQGGDIDSAIRYEGEYDAFQVKSALGYGWVNNQTATTGSTSTETILNAAVSVKHDSGLAGTVAYAAQSLENKATGNDDPTGYYVKLGYEWDNFGVAADWASFDDGIVATTTDHSLSSFGLGGQYDMGNGVSAGALYRYYEADISGVNTDEINVFALNMNVKF